jgi:predicted phage baseplate assembly protein
MTAPDMLGALGAASSGAPRLDPCGCCEAGPPPPRLYNRPGLPALAYRIATHPPALRRMLDAVSRTTVPPDDPAGDRPLRQLSTRAGDDPSIALLDAWATVTDVLTFYQERIANEGYLGTATERRSVLELARAIGYELDPGVAAGAFLRFTVEDAPGAPGVAAVPLGTRVQSIPGQGQLPQTFETSEAIEARAEWNVLRPRQTEPQPITVDLRQLYLKGVTTQLQPGDPILLCGDERMADPGSERWDLRIVKTVTPLPAPPSEPESPGYTIVTWEEGLGHKQPSVAPSASARVYAFRQRAALFGYNAPQWVAMATKIQRAFDPNYDTANDRPSLSEWPDFEIQRARERLIDLDAFYPRILVGSWIVLTRPGYVEVYQVVEVTPASRTDYTLTAKTTRITLDTNEHLTWFGLRDTAAYTESDELQLAERPFADPTVQGNRIELDRLVSGLRGGQPLFVSGQRIPSDSDGAAGDDSLVHEVVFIDDGPDAITADGQRTTLTLRAPLAHVYDRTTVTINANVARATHGETVREEILGSGAGAVGHQQFALRRRPLTYVSAPTATGTQSTLDVRVNGVLWQQVPSLFGLAPDSQGYEVRIDDDSLATLTFGDGKMGARLPTGTENVAATYRFGTGLAGMVDANQLSLLQVRPLGIRGVDNPLPATGGADAESLADARRNAPLTVLTLERIVSLRDYEDFARAFAGIGKAQAVALWINGEQVIHITVAGAQGTPVPSTSDVYVNLVRAIASQRDPVNRVLVASHTPRRFGVEAKVLVDPRLVAADVIGRVADALRRAFAFEQRAFGQAATAAEVIQVMQGVPGVVAVDLDRLVPDTPPLPPESEQPVAVLPASAARLLPDGTIAPAELLLLDPQAIHVEEMAP